jgi:hypothetical protein
MTFGLNIIPVLFFNLILKFFIINYSWLKSGTETKLRQCMYALYVYICKRCVGRILNARDKILQCYSCFSAVWWNICDEAGKE